MGFSLMDKTLLAIARTAEEGGQAPPLHVITGNFFVVGQPVSQRAFADAWAEAVTEDHLRIDRPRRRDRESARQHLLTEANSILEPVRQSFTPGDLDAICFAPARAVFLSTTEAGDVPCLRVPLDQVEAWWGGETQWEQGGGSGFFVGGFLPMGD